MSEYLMKIDLSTFAQDTRKANYLMYDLIQQLNRSNVSVELLNLESFNVDEIGVYIIQLLNELPLKNDAVSQADYFVKLDLVKFKDTGNLLNTVLQEVFQRKVRVELVNPIASPDDEFGWMLDYETFTFLQLLPQVN
ncbi:hypothetical protein [Entomomonas asaccharolytica]|uniref:Uncharacterized protein n=1 Tax=Entomomonas asaccharolytica TaxID=2785331 RepID=A0A974RW49_9GAMM|nr:hypothetical protein [Entomomonas asaccharolytica]QQP84712.1 hypothetical protein JHT90_09865 [Entomomonas asaccharolytica]